MIIEIEILIEIDVRKYIIFTKISHQYILENPRINVKQYFHSFYVLLTTSNKIRATHGSISSCK